MKSAAVPVAPVQERVPHTPVQMQFCVARWTRQGCGVDAPQAQTGPGLPRLAWSGSGPLGCLSEAPGWLQQEGSCESPPGDEGDSQPRSMVVGVVQGVGVAQAGRCPGWHCVLSTSATDLGARQASRHSALTHPARVLCLQPGDQVTAAHCTMSLSGVCLSPQCQVALGVGARWAPLRPPQHQPCSTQAERPPQPRLGPPLGADARERGSGFLQPGSRGSPPRCWSQSGTTRVASLHEVPKKGGKWSQGWLLYLPKAPGLRPSWARGLCNVRLGSPLGCSVQPRWAQGERRQVPRGLSCTSWAREPRGRRELAPGPRQPRPEPLLLARSWALGC